VGVYQAVESLVDGLLVGKLRRRNRFLRRCFAWGDVSPMRKRGGIFLHAKHLNPATLVDVS
jgi:hypothetical protein